MLIAPDGRLSTPRSRSHHRVARQKAVTPDRHGSSLSHAPAYTNAKEMGLQNSYR